MQKRGWGAQRQCELYRMASKTIRSSNKHDDQCSKGTEEESSELERSCKKSESASRQEGCSLHHLRSAKKFSYFT